MKRLALAAGAILTAFGLVVAVMLLLGKDFREEPGIGSVDTAFKLLGADHSVAVDVFDDPKVEGVACFISRARTGGVRGSLGLREDTSDASIACRQVGPIRFTARLKNGERVFAERRSLLFKTLQVVRFYAPEHRTLVYLSYSDKLVEGSPKNAISAVALMPWSGEPAGTPELE